MEIAVEGPAFPLPSSNEILLLQILFRILFLGWATLRKHGWVTFAERRSDKGNAVTHIALNHHFSPNTQLNRDLDADTLRVRQKALLQFQKEYTHIDAQALNVAMDIIDARATGRVVSPQFYLKSLEQFFISTRDERALEIELAVIADQKKTRQEKIDIWAGKVAHGDAALMDKARAASG